MDSYHAGLIVAFLLAAGIGVAMTGTTDGPAPTAINCPESGACTTTTVNTTWSCPTDARKAPNCTRTQDREAIEDVTFVSDPKNHITAPLAKVNATVDRAEYPGISTWDFEFLPDGDVLTTYHTSPSIYRFDPTEAEPAPEVIGNISGQVSTDIYGTQGLALDPDFEQNRRFYVFYVYNKSQVDGELQLRSKVAAYRYEDGSMRHIEDLLTGIIGHRWHNGGRLEFGPEGKLYVTTGDAGQSRAPADPEVLLGKVLRINPDGTIPEDNPFNSSVYTTGHRNVQGIAWQPGTNETYIAEHGSWRHDEVNRLEAGDNYGWGRYACGDVEQPVGGPYPDENHPPVRCFEEWTMAPSDIAFVDQPGHPWHGDAFIAGLRSRHLHRLQLTADGEVTSSEIFWYNGRFSDADWTDGADPAKKVRDVEFHDGALWLGTTSNIMFRLTPAS